MRNIILCFFIAIFSDYKLSAQVLPSVEHSKSSAISQLATLSYSDKDLRKLFPTFDGYWHAFALTKTGYNSDKVQLL